VRTYVYVPCRFKEDYGRREPKVVGWAEHRGVAAEQDDGGPRERQRAERVAHPLDQRDGAHAAVERLLRRGCGGSMAAAAASRSFDARPLRHGRLEQRQRSETQEGASVQVSARR